MLAIIVESFRKGKMSLFALHSSLGGSVIGVSTCHHIHTHKDKTSRSPTLAIRSCGSGGTLLLIAKTKVVVNGAGSKSSRRTICSSVSNATSTFRSTSSGGSLKVARLIHGVDKIGVFNTTDTSGFSFAMSKQITISFDLHPPSGTVAPNVKASNTYSFTVEDTPDPSRFYERLNSAVHVAKEKIGQDLTTWRDAVGGLELGKEVKKAREPEDDLEEVDGDDEEEA
jgi:hypothetical protein